MRGNKVSQLGVEVGAYQLDCNGASSLEHHFDRVKIFIGGVDLDTKVLVFVLAPASLLERGSRNLA